MAPLGAASNIGLLPANEKPPASPVEFHFKLLSYLIERRGKVVSKQELFQNVWEDKFTGDGTLNVHIRRLREAIEFDPTSPKYIVTVWGDGYKFIGGDGR